MKEVKIISDGTPEGTFLFFDDVKVENVRSIEFECSSDDFFADIRVGYIPFAQTPPSQAEEDLVEGINAAIGVKDEIPTETIQGTD